MNQPNMVFVLADDLAVWGLGCYGNDEIHTPNIDALASEGVLFSDFYCTSPVCSPSRASMLTGKPPSGHGVLDWIRGGNGENGDGIAYLEEEFAYTEGLAAHGYTCGISGKWHLGDGRRPQKGYEHWFVFPSGGGEYNNASMFTPDGVVETEGYLTDVITDDAIAFIRDNAENDSPFYLNVNFTAPHSPWVDQHPKELLDLYADCDFRSCPREAPHPWAHQYPAEMLNSKQYADSERRDITVHDLLQGYFAAVSGIDRAVGRIRAELERLQISDDTIVVFTSDNGFNCGHHGIWGKGNGTFPANMYDSSVKVPLVIWAPSMFGQRVCDTMLSGYDVMPTILDLAGLTDEIPPGIPGHSFAGCLSGEAMAGEEPVVVHDEFGPTRMIRSREWKYVHRYPYGPHELYDLRHDPGERLNLLLYPQWADSTVEPASVAADLQRTMEEWFDRYSTPQFDGRVQPVTGRGQLRLASEHGAGVFHGQENSPVKPAPLAR